MLVLCASALALTFPQSASATPPAGSSPCPSFSVGPALKGTSGWLSAGAADTCADAEALLRESLRKARLNERFTSELGAEDAGVNGTFMFGAVDNGCRIVPAESGMAITWRCALTRWDEAAGQPVGSAAGGTLTLPALKGRRCGRARYSEGEASGFVLRKLPCSARGALMRAAALGGAPASHTATGGILVRAKGMWCVGRSEGVGLTTTFACGSTGGRAARFRVRGS